MIGFNDHPLGTVHALPSVAETASPGERPAARQLATAGKPRTSADARGVDNSRQQVDGGWPSRSGLAMPSTPSLQLDRDRLLPMDPALRSGFIDDTRAFCSIPARHEMSRRLDAGYLAQLVGEGRHDENDAAETAIDLVSSNPRKALRL
jgi:hypothetical protein